MATLKKSKLEALIAHINKGGDSDPETYASILGVDPEDTETISAYIRRAKASLPKKEEPTPTPGPTVYQLRGADGIVRDLDFIKQKGNRIILEVPVVRDLVDIVIKGKEVTVDLEQLRKLDPDSLLHETAVRRLIAAAELAKG